MSNLIPESINNKGEATMENIAEINRDLALAAGWKDKDIHVKGGVVSVGKERRIWDYRDPTILWPLAAIFDAFPFVKASLAEPGWAACSGKDARTRPFHADTPEMASALSIIATAKHWTPPAQ